MSFFSLLVQAFAFSWMISPVFSGQACKINYGYQSEHNKGDTFKVVYLFDFRREGNYVVPGFYELAAVNTPFKKEEIRTYTCDPSPKKEFTVQMIRNGVVCDQATISVKCKDPPAPDPQGAATINFATISRVKLGTEFTVFFIFKFHQLGNFVYQISDNGNVDVANQQVDTLNETKEVQKKFTCDVDPKVITVQVFFDGNMVAQKQITVRCTKCPSVKTDPHFMTFSEDMFDYHGECDLVLLKNPNYKQGTGMEIHVRTKRENSFTYVQSAVVSIGGETFEVTGAPDNKIWLNDVENAPLPARLAGHPVGHRHIDEDHEAYHILLDNDSGNIVISTYQNFVNVEIENAISDSFAGSLGLMGSYETGEKLGRDGVTTFVDINDFAQEWQVQISDAPQLFHSIEGPQAPDNQCALPGASVQQRRHLRPGATNDVSLEEAGKACAFAHPRDFDNCVSDVLATSDTGIAGVY